MTSYIDGHCHLNSPELRKNLDSHVAQALSAGVGRMLVVGTDIETSEESVDIADRYFDVGVRAAVGIHPHDASSAGSELPEGLTVLSGRKEVVAIGEVGLDYHYDYSSRKEQRDVLIAQLLWAKAEDSPVVFHVREAFEDFFRILKDFPLDPGMAVVHCFSGSWSEAKSCLDLGFFLGFGGMITFKKADEVRECLASCPLDRVILETDSPWLSPVPFRGKLNSPANMPIIYETAADVIGIREAALIDAVWSNGIDLYRWEGD